jgi:hypothetical protein
MDDEKDIVNAIKYANDLPYLENKVQQILYDVDALERKINDFRIALSALQNQISAAKDSLKYCQSALDDKIQYITAMHKKLEQLENIKNNNKDYQKIERVAEQKANDILNNKKAVILAAVIAVFVALRNHPEKQQLLIYDSFYPLNDDADAISYITKMMSSSTENSEKNHRVPLPFHHKEILTMAEGLYDNLLKVVVNNTIYPAAVTQ